MLKLINKFLTIATVLTLALGAYFLTSAQEGSSGGPASTSVNEDLFAGEDDYACVRGLKALAEEKRREFGKFMNDHFRSVLPTSQLIPDTIQKYREYRAELRQYIKEFLPEGGRVGEKALAEVPFCERALADEFVLIDQLIHQHIVENALAKRTTGLLTAYKRINDKLGKLNFTIAQMVGYFSILSEKLPCYPTQCSRG